MKKQFIALGFIILLSVLSQAQEMQWVVPPTFKGYDNVEIKNQLIKYIIVKKDGKYGVRTPKNEEIVPTIYNSISQVKEDYFSAYHDKNDQGKVNSFFDEDGYQIDYDKKIKPKFDAKQRKERNDKANKAEQWITTNFPGIQKVEGKYSSSTFIKSDGDTLLKDLVPHHMEVVADKYLVHKNTSNKDGQVMIDNTGTVRLEAKKLDVWRNEDNGHTVVGYKILVDEKGEIHFNGNEKVEKIFRADYYKVTKEKDKTFVYDYNLEQIFSKPHKYVGAKNYDDERFIIGYNENETSIYTVATKETTTLPFKLDEIRGTSVPAYTFKEGDLVGIYNLKTKQTELAPKYKYAKPLGPNYYYGANDKYSRKKKNSKTFERNILNNQGEVIYSSINNGIGYVGDGYYQVVTSDSTKILLDSDMNEVGSYYTKGRDNITFSNGWAIMKKNKEGRERIGYPISNFLKEDKSVWYDGLPKAVKAAKGFSDIYIVKQNGKIGFTDKDGKTILPCELDKISGLDKTSGEYKGYFLAEKKGKWGVMQRPSN